MSLTNFIKVLKRDVFKIDETTQKVVPVAETVTAESWESFRHHPGKAAIPPFRYHGQYNAPLDKLGTIAKYMSTQFNAYCSEAGVQCTVMMDPRDFQQLFHFTNNGDRLLLIEYDREFHYLEPKQSMTCKVRQRLDGQPNIPRITPLNNGV